MEFKKKISNVAFGGNWSEELLTQYELAQALLLLQWAVDNCREKDVNTSEVQMALHTLTNDLEKGKMLSERFKRGHLISDQFARKMHFCECFSIN